VFSYYDFNYGLRLSWYICSQHFSPEEQKLMYRPVALRGLNTTHQSHDRDISIIILGCDTQFGSYISLFQINVLPPFWLEQKDLSTSPKTVNFSCQYLRSQKREKKSSNARLDFMQAWRQTLDPWFNFNPPPLNMTKPWNHEEQQSLCPCPHQNLWGLRGGGDVYQTGGPASSILIITPSLNDATQITPQLGHSTLLHQFIGEQTWKINRIITGGTTNLPTNQPTNQHICRQFCQQHAENLNTPTGTTHLLRKW
jgi:hypothetical protein